MLIVRKSFAQIPILRAEESIEAVTRTAVGSGVLEPRTARNVLGDWADTASANDAPRPPSAETAPRPIPGMGLGLKRH